MTDENEQSDAPPTAADLRPAIEAMLIATGEPIAASAMAKQLGTGQAAVLAAIEEMRAHYADAAHGVDIVEIAEGFQIGTKPRYTDVVKTMLHEVRKARLSPASLETLAIVAYRQPVTRAEIEAIRGVNIDGVMKTLLERELIKITGKKEEPGRPLVYGTTETFLMHFGLKDVTDLPPLTEYEEIARARAAGEIDKQAGPDWGEIADTQRQALDELAEAAERELGDLDQKLSALKPPKVVAFEEK